MDKAKQASRDVKYVSLSNWAQLWGGRGGGAEGKEKRTGSEF